MPHPSRTDLYSTLDPCAINHYQGEESRGGEQGMERRRGRTKRKGQMGGGRAVERQESDGEEAIEGGGGGVAVYRISAK